MELGRRLSLQHLLARDFSSVRGGLQPFCPARLISRWEPTGLEGSLRMLRAGEASLPQPLLSLCIWASGHLGKAVAWSQPPLWRMESTVTLLVVCSLPSVLWCQLQRKFNPPNSKGQPKCLEMSSTLMQEDFWWADKSIPQELVKLLPTYQKGPFPFSLAKGTYGSPISIRLWCLSAYQGPC